MTSQVVEVPGEESGRGFGLLGNFLAPKGVQSGGIPLICFSIYKTENDRFPFLCFANIQKEKGNNRCFSLLVFMDIFCKLVFCAF